MPTSKPLRAWLDGRRRRSDRDRPARATGTSRPGARGAIVRADAVGGGPGPCSATASRSATANGEAGGSRRSGAAQGAIDGVLELAATDSEPAIHRALTRGPRRRRLGRRRLEHADPRQRGLPADRRPPRSASSPTAAPTGSTGTISTAAGVALETGGRPGSSSATSRSLTTSAAWRRWRRVGHADADRRHRQRRRRHLRLPAAGRAGRRRRASSGSSRPPRRLDLERVADLFDLPFHEMAHPTDLEALAGAHGVLARAQVRRDGNVDLHREIAAAVAAALSP